MQQLHRLNFDGSGVNFWFISDHLMNLQRYNSSFSRSSIYLPSLVIKNISKIGQHAQLVASAIFYIQCVVLKQKASIWWVWHWFTMNWCLNFSISFSSLHSVPIILSKVSFLAFIEKWHDWKVQLCSLVLFHNCVQKYTLSLYTFSCLLTISCYVIQSEKNME